MPKPTDIRAPFTAETAAAKVQAAEDAWNTRDPYASINDLSLIHI